MSEFEENVDSDVSSCPYCGESFEPEVETYDEDPHEIECDGCGKKYWLQQSFEVQHISRPDCELNGNKHRWVEGFQSPYTGTRWDACDICGKVVRIEAKD